jgi:hypothetical protein
MIPSSLARVRPSTQSIDERPVEPEETADDVEEVVGVRETVGESLSADVGAILEESVVVGTELLHSLSVHRVAERNCFHVLNIAFNLVSLTLVQ